MEYKIKIILSSLNDQPSYMTVDGEPLVIPGYEEFEFFIHNDFGRKLFVSEVSTGMGAGLYSTKEAAIKAIQKKIKGKGIEALRKLIADNKMPE
ncbi:MAG: hypothetical protein PHQ86_01840 [Dehalococcoidales bacterium]|nr:hypothetical protein [Dehalococcoidales bacterium]